ncbi:molybdenum cofactor biosynthesis protein B [Aestuariicella hydrocarbonica]|uniref:Molybdenum cofactor biosynthesis protein B n=1 Tax=Pseudomaricurvus hydrocarbonicus TaxID=1470433 RepID=A0A9E5JRG4_9GAMM|nr:molybdenum cofactor biosynthesis protein B [Aestuariicella hydrocarbonica]NHO64021.1 molybdenum cofactor biosynthesis protein B [Aestuariicella hydrocarbonica]
MRAEFIPLNLAVLTVSDTRTEETDTSGHLLRDALIETGHHYYDHQIVIDDIYQIRAATSQWIANSDIHGILITGGTGFHGRDSTPEAMLPLFDKTIDGFGELFRQVSFDQIGSSTIQSRCVGGLANRTVIFCLPGSNNACKTGWEHIIKPQLDNRQKPCNFVGLVTQRD